MRRGVGQIYAMAIMLALMISTLLVGLGVEEGLTREVQGNLQALQAADQSRLEKLQVTQSAAQLNVENTGTIPVTLSFIHSDSADRALGLTLQPGEIWSGQSLGSSSNYVVTSRGNVFMREAAVAGGQAQLFPASASLFYSPLASGSYFILNPLYASPVGALTKADITSGTDWTLLYPPDLPWTTNSNTTWLLPSSDPNYTLLYTQYYQNVYFVNLLPYRLQAPQAQRFSFNSSYAVTFRSAQQGFLALDTHYSLLASSRDTFWSVYRPLSSSGAVLTSYDPGPFPSRDSERFFGFGQAASNGTHIAEFGYGTSYSYETTGTFPFSANYGYSSMFIRLLRWGSGGVTFSALYNVSSNYPPFPYLADDPLAWANATCAFGNRLAVRVAMRSSTNAYTLLDVYDLDSGRLVARRLLSNNTYTSSSFPANSFRIGFLDADHLVLQDDYRGALQVLSVSGNLSTLASATSLQPSAKLGGALPVVPFDYTGITDYYLIPGTGLAYLTYAGAYFYDYNLTLTKALSFAPFEPQPKSPCPAVLVSNSTVVALVVDPSGASSVRVFGP
jgi:hypothetical protein